MARTTEIINIKLTRCFGLQHKPSSGAERKKKKKRVGLKPGGSDYPKSTIRQSWYGGLSPRELGTRSHVAGKMNEPLILVNTFQKV